MIKKEKEIPFFRLNYGNVANQNMFANELAV